MDYPKRKRLRLPDYDYSSEGVYFLTLCTKARAPILSNIKIAYENGETVAAISLTHLGGIVQEYILSIPKAYPYINVDSYVIMPDHVHLLLRITSVPARRAESLAQPFATKEHYGCGIPPAQPFATKERYGCGVPPAQPFATKERYGCGVPLAGIAGIAGARPTASVIAQTVAVFKRLTSRDCKQTLWQDGYYDHIIRDAQDYQTRIEYIETNPLRKILNKE